MKSNIHHGFEKQKSYYYIQYGEIMQRDGISWTIDLFNRLIYFNLFIVGTISFYTKKCNS